MKGSDLLPFALWTAVVVTLGMAMMGYQIWPLCVALFFLLLYAVAKEAPEPVKHDLGMHDRTIEHLDKFEDGFISLTTAMGLPYIGRERRRWRGHR